MSIRTKNGKWEYRFWLNGARVTKLTDLEATSENRTKAERLEKKHRDSIVRGDQPARRQIARGFIDASREFIGYCKVEHPAKDVQVIHSTVRRIETSMASMRDFFDSRTVASIRVPDVERYKVHRLQNHGVQPITLRHDLDTLSKFFEWAIRMELRTDNPVRKVKKPSAEDAIRMHVITEAEEDEYFQRIEESGKYRNLAHVGRLILDQGMRPDEVMRIEKSAVDLVNGKISVLRGKTKAARRTLYLMPLSRMIVEQRMQERLDSKWLFPSPRKAGQPLTKLNTAHDAVCQGTDEREQLCFVLYDLRHTYATRAAQAGMDLGTLAATLGHSSLRMVTRYMHIQQDHIDAEMRKLAEKQRPRLKVVRKA